MIVVLDYGMGNLRSVEKAVQFLGYECLVQKNLSGATKLIIPGVGAFGAAMERISPLKEEIWAFAGGGAPILGICLGQQLLFETSEEMGEHEGLGLVAGRVKYFSRSRDSERETIDRRDREHRQGPRTHDAQRTTQDPQRTTHILELKVPQIGWNEACFKPNTRLGVGVEPGDQLYFVHSLYTECSDPTNVAATTTYGLTFASAIEKGNIWGVQFHPEKSGDVGLRILRNFLEC